MRKKQAATNQHRTDATGYEIRYSSGQGIPCPYEHVGVLRQTPMCCHAQ
jgi:hypothetical protein